MLLYWGEFATVWNEVGRSCTVFKGRWGEFEILKWWPVLSGGFGVNGGGGNFFINAFDDQWIYERDYFFNAAHKIIIYVL